MKRNDKPRDDIRFGNLMVDARALINFLEQEENREGADDAAVKERFGWDDEQLKAARIAAGDYVEDGGASKPKAQSRTNVARPREDKGDAQRRSEDDNKHI